MCNISNMLGKATPCIGLLVVVLTLVTSHPIDHTTTSQPIDHTTTSHPIDNTTTSHPIDHTTTSHPISVTATSRPVDDDIQRSVQYPCGSFWENELPVTIQSIDDCTDADVTSVFRKLLTVAADLATRTEGLKLEAQSIQSLIHDETNITNPQPIGIFNALLTPANSPIHGIFSTLQGTNTNHRENITQTTSGIPSKRQVVKQMIATMQLTKHLLFIMAAHEQEMLTEGNISLLTQADNMAANLHTIHTETCQAIRTVRISLFSYVDQSQDNYTVNSLLSNNFPSLRSSYVAYERAYKIMNDVIEMTTQLHQAFTEMENREQEIDLVG